MDTGLDVTTDSRQSAEDSKNGSEQVFTGQRKQNKAFANPVIFELENEWTNFDRTSNRSSDRTRNSAENNDVVSNSDIYRNVMENALNVAFLAANTNQLRLLTEYQQEATSYMFCVGMIIMSLVMQILVSVSMITISINNEQRWKKLKTVASVVVAVIAVVNIIVLTLLNAVLFE
ncbi:ninjurin-B-like [Topomyia yanbarensis]|uniref:ninjurin-B-like n=1 Tax=Topomyia yanbarensis TaxID=2498891 RepID=UPI00273B16F5|nr:ninjurin-B-like [Topomyia yanbarensis]